MTAHWDGVTLRSTYNKEIVAQRDRLADAAKAGNWKQVLGLLEANPEWVTRGRVGGKSGYTPLHQAAWHGTDERLTAHLIELGAWRTLRTSTGQRAHDIAREKGTQ